MTAVKTTFYNTKENPIFLFPSHIHIPTIGKVRMETHNIPLDAKIISATVIEDKGEWQVELQVEV